MPDMILEATIQEKDDHEFAQEGDPWERKQVHLGRLFWECKLHPEPDQQAAARRTVCIAAAGLTGLEYSDADWERACQDLREEKARDIEQCGDDAGTWIFSERVHAALAHAEHLAATTEGE